MDEKTKALLIQIAGFLTLIASGVIAAPEHAMREAKELLDKIGDAVGPQA